MKEKKRGKDGSLEYASDSNGTEVSAAREGEDLKRRTQREVS
jgi:hypothetical protein